MPRTAKWCFLYISVVILFSMIPIFFPVWHTTITTRNMIILKDNIYTYGENERYVTFKKDGQHRGFIFTPPEHKREYPPPNEDSVSSLVLRKVESTHINYDRMLIEVIGVAICALPCIWLLLIWKPRLLSK